MPQINKSIVDELEYKVKRLLHQSEVISDENTLFISRIQALMAEMDLLEEQYRELETKYNNLKLANGLALSEEDRKSANRRFSKLVREINTCITLLKE
ncbi:MAG: hypothetical protein ACRCZM_04380 [Bacteroidales bacterium]